MPLLSIIIPVYNAEATIERTILSLSRISGANRDKVTVIGIDDGSSDRSPEIFEATIKTAGIDYRLIRKQNGGSGTARNRGLATVTTEWVFFLDADDELIFDPVPYIDGGGENSSLAFSIRFCKQGQLRGRLMPLLISPQNFLDALTSHNPFQPSSLIFRMDRLDHHFDPSFLYLEDWLFWLMNPRIFEQMKVFPDVTSALIHSHGMNKTSNRVLHGKYRTSIAEKILSDLKGKLTRKQRNNMIIQSRIGMIMERKKVSPATFFLLPCNALLFLKLIVYFFFEDVLSRYDFYGN